MFERAAGVALWHLQWWRRTSNRNVWLQRMQRSVSLSNCQGGRAASLSWRMSSRCAMRNCGRGHAGAGAALERGAEGRGCERMGVCGAYKKANDEMPEEKILKKRLVEWLL